MNPVRRLDTLFEGIPLLDRAMTTPEQEPDLDAMIAVANLQSSRCVLGMLLHLWRNYRSRLHLRQHGSVLT